MNAAAADHELATLLSEVRTLVADAGRAILEVYGGAHEVEYKADDSPITRADRAAHEILASGLRRLTPDIPVLSEESAAEHAVEVRRHWRELWLVDPLDGTKEFIGRNGEFTVNVALIRDQVPVLGVVAAPVLGLVYGGAQGLGAFVAHAGGSDRPIRTRVPAANPLVVVGSRSHRGDSLDGLLARLGPHELRPMGSSLKFCLVAEGSADFYPRLGPTSEWDTAAAQAVVEAAGGRVVTLDGAPLRYNARDTLLNPHFLAYGDPGRDWQRFA
ncbi:MAG TPA: 3'(2'),5'-bisphosphate nucleotidase CysQ [Steroidobacteraceae bacterium]|nr:3'(2'),5'-bisphosphate nucleotidase CysQ [Steroidobacteraceae bacterium]